ncbi:MAG TPA: tetratricopeptide repeat protein [Gammaproteobacteria bacterium]|nr:tetratricopeptide repeat protein [Gammaproteobacteria bacterium]
MARKKPVPQEPISFLARLKQHHLYGVVVTYAVVVGFLIQLVSRAFPYFGWAGAVPTVIVVLLLGFPVVAVLAWLLIEPKGPAQSDSWQRRHWKLSAVVTAVVIVLVVISGFYALQFSRQHAALLQSSASTAMQQHAAIPGKSIAVLPFENLSNDKNNAYFADGMQDLILTKLADIGDLKVISRTSTAQYASHPEDLKRIGEQLGVTTILEGSVQKAGNQVLINVQLIDALTDAHIWAQAYTRTLDNVFGVEGEVAEQIATALQARLSPAESATLAAVPTQNRAAYDLFLRAEYQANKGLVNYDTASWKAAIPLYRQAVQQDPNFALAWARLSYNESQLAWFGGGGENVQQLNQQARADAERALQLQPKLSAAHLALGYTEYWGRGDYAAALSDFTAALKLKPNDADALSAQAYVERRQGRFDDAIASFQKSLTLDPRNSATAYELGFAYMLASRYADAENAFQRALALDPDNRNAKVNNSLAILLSTGDIARALAAAQGDDPGLKLQRVNLLVDQRRYHEALALLDSIPDTLDNFSVNSGGSKSQQQANIYWLMGDRAHARPLYAQALAPLRAQLKMLQGINVAFVWQGIANMQTGLGQTEAALDAIDKSRSILDHIKDQVYGPGGMLGGAQLYAQLRRPDLAVPLLAKTLTTPGIGGSYSPVMLWLDPLWDPIRQDASFQALLKQYAQYKPAVIPTIPASTSN